MRLTEGTFSVVDVEEFCYRCGIVRVFMTDPEKRIGSIYELQSKERSLVEFG
jgi:hypothetical protein